MICSGRNFGQSFTSVWENGFSWWLDTWYLGGAKMSWTSGLFVFHVWMLLGFKLSLRINETCRRVTTIIFIRIHHSKHSRRNAPVLVIVFRINFLSWDQNHFITRSEEQVGLFEFVFSQLFQNIFSKFTDFVSTVSEIPIFLCFLSFQIVNIHSFKDLRCCFRLFVFFSWCQAQNKHPTCLNWNSLIQFD